MTEFLFFLVSVFCFIGIIYPTKWHQYFNFSKRWQWALIWFGLLVVSGVVGAFDGESQKNIASTAKPSSTPAAAVDKPAEKPKTKPATPQLAKIGQWVKAGKLEYRVDSVEETDKIKGFFETHKPDADNFAILTVSIRNNDTETRYITAEMTKLKDKQNRTFEPDSDVTIDYKSKHDLNGSDEIPPTGERQIVIIYDIRGSAKDYTFHGGDGFLLAGEGKEAVISLGE